MAGKSKGKVELQIEVKTQNQWDDLMAKDGLIVVDAYAGWCGPCKAIVSSLKRLKNEVGDNLLHFALAETDNIESLEKYRMKSQPTFLFYTAGQLRHVVRGCNCPLLMKCIKQQLEKEHKAIEQGIEREAFSDTAVEAVVLPDATEKKDEEKEVDDEEEEIAERMTKAKSKHSYPELSEEATESVEMEKKVAVAIIKPDAVKAGHVDEIIQNFEESGWEVLRKEERILSKEEAAEFYKQHEGTEHYEQLVEFMASGPCLTLVLSKAGETLDTANENVIMEFRDLIGPKDINVAKDEAPESLRAKYGTDSLMNAIHACDSSESAARELGFFFPDFVAPTVAGKRKKRKLQRTLALIRPHALQERKDSILAKINEAGFTIAMSKEITFTREQAEDFYAEHKNQDFFDTLVSNMTSGPMLALCLAREDAVEGWREVLGPKEVEAQQEAPESLRAQFQVENNPINSLHGSDSVEAARKEIQKIFPMQSTLAVIKPETEPGERETIIQRIKEAGFNISLNKEVTLTKELAEQFYHEHEGKDFYSGLTEYMSSGPTQFLVLSREDAVSGWRALMGPTDPQEAKEQAPQSLRAQFGVDKLKNVVHGSSNEDKAKDVIKTFFPEVEILPDGTVKVAETESKEEEKDEPAAKKDEGDYSKALGVGVGGGIPDGNLSSSSALDDTCGAARGRLNIAKDGELKAAWCAQENDENQWIQVDCGKVVRLAKIETQGRGDDENQRVTSYCVLYSNNGHIFIPYRENAEIKVFDGNSDQEAIVCNQLATPVFAQFFRIQPKTWNQHIAMRLELHGCDAEMYSKALGVGNGRIPDGNLSSSSALDDTCGAARGRLNIVKDGDLKAAWCAQENDENQWIQVDCGKLVLVTRLAIQGRDDEAHWVTSYTFSYSHNGKDFTEYEENDEVKVFEGNTDKDTVVYQWLSLPVIAWYFRINPKTWNAHVALRMELFGRETESESNEGEQKEAETSATGEEDGKPVAGDESGDQADGKNDQKPEEGEQESTKQAEAETKDTDPDKPDASEEAKEAEVKVDESVENKEETSESKEDSTAEQPAAGDDDEPQTNQEAASTEGEPSSEETKSTEGEEVKT